MNYDDLTLSELEKHLDIKQRKFVANLVAGHGKGESAINAGYAVRSASAQATELLKKPKISAYRRALTRAVLESHGLTTDAIALRLFEIYERCMQKEPVMDWDSESQEWVETGVWKFDSKGATRVLELLGKNAGMFTDRVKVDGAAELLIKTSGSIDEAGG